MGYRVWDLKGKYILVQRERILNINYESGAMLDVFHVFLFNIW